MLKDCELANVDVKGEGLRDWRVFGLASVEWACLENIGLLLNWPCSLWITWINDEMLWSQGDPENTPRGNRRKEYKTIVNKETL